MDTTQNFECEVGIFSVKVKGKMIMGKMIKKSFCLKEYQSICELYLSLRYILNSNSTWVKISDHATIVGRLCRIFADCPILQNHRYCGWCE